jgi:hypothetical protein
MGLTAAVAREFAGHAGCAAVASLVRLAGVDHDTIVRWRRQGLIIRVHRGVDRVVGAPRTPEQRLWAALLRAGRFARAGARASCWLHGLDGFGAPVVDVVVEAPHRARATGFPAVTRDIGAQDRASVRGFCCLSATRAIIELAHTLEARELRVLIDSARRKRLLTIEGLRRRAQALSSVTGCRRGAAAVLDLIGTGTFDRESEVEREIFDFLSTTTLQLEWQVTDLVPNRRLDAVDRAALLILELDSRAWHTLGSDRDHDGLRDLEVVEAAEGYVVFHLTLGMVRFAPEETRRRLDAIRAQRISSSRAER